MAPHLNKTKARAALAKKGWTQADLARALGSGESHVSRIFNGLKPSTEYRARLEEVLGNDIWRGR